MLKLITRNAQPEFETRERCSIVEILNDAESSDVSIARCRVKPGIITELHSLRNTKETYVIEAGQAMMDDGECEPIAVEIGDKIMISSGHPQRIRNIGECDLIFLAVCNPRFEPECYIPLEGE